jgi:hypothetical protein
VPFVYNNSLIFYNPAELSRVFFLAFNQIIMSFKKEEISVALSATFYNEVRKILGPSTFSGLTQDELALTVWAFNDILLGMLNELERADLLNFTVQEMAKKLGIEHYNLMVTISNSTFTFRE